MIDFTSARCRISSQLMDSWQVWKGVIRVVIEGKHRLMPLGSSSRAKYTNNVGPNTNKHVRTIPNVP